MLVARENIGPWFCLDCDFTVLRTEEELYVFGLKLKKEVVTKESLQGKYSKHVIVREQVTFTGEGKVDAETALVLGFPILEPGEGPIKPSFTHRLGLIMDDLRVLHADEIHPHNLGQLLEYVEDAQSMCETFVDLAQCTMCGIKFQSDGVVLCERCLRVHRKMYEDKRP